MRRDGVKLPTEQLRDAASTRGHLRLKAVPWRSAYTPNLAMVPTVFASLHPDEACRETTLLPALRQARIERLEGDSFVVVGLDQQGEYMREVDYPQAWACRVVT
jgi:hypothetical protein